MATLVGLTPGAGSAYDPLTMRDADLARGADAPRYSALVRVTRSPEALHPQTLLTVAMNDGDPPVGFGGPLRKGLRSMDPEGGYAWYAGIQVSAVMSGDMGALASILQERTMPNLLKISTDTTVFPWAKRTPASGLRASIAVALALLAGMVAGHPGAGAIAAGAAFTIGFAIFHEALASALLSMGLLTLGLASGTLIGSLGAQITWLVLVLVVVAAINYGLLSGLSPTAGWMGQQCAVFVIVASFFPHGLRDAAGRTAMVLAGGALQMLVFTGFYLVRHRAREAAAAPLTSRLRMRISELLSRLRNELRLTGDTASYVVRLSVTLLLCTELYRRFHVRNGYWSPMTALLVLKPQWTDTLSRGIARLLGTLAGAGVAILLGMYVPLHTAVIVSLILFSAWACFALQAVNYAAFSLFVTLYIVYLFRFGGFSQTAAAHIRLYNTALGGTIAIVIDVAWKLLTPGPHSSSSHCRDYKV